MTNERSKEEIADAALAAEDWEKAVDFFSQAIQENPGDHTLYGRRATAFLGMGEQHQAASMFALQDAQQSCMMDPTYVDGYILCSKASILSRDLWKAEVVVRKGLLVAPENALLMAQLERAQQARNDPSVRPKFTIGPIWDPPDKYGLVHTHGLCWEGLPELLMVDVPRDMLMPSSMEILDSVAGSLQEGTNIAHGDTINVDGDRVQALVVSEEANRAAMMKIVGIWNEDTEVMILKLLDEDNLPEPRERETVVPSAPDGNETGLKNILDKWRDVESFTLFVDGDKENENETNCVSIPLSFMLQLGPKVPTNWDSTLTHEEGQYAFDNWDAIRHHARADLLGVGYEVDGRYIQNIVRHAQSPTMVQSRYQQGVKLATED